MHSPTQALAWELWGRHRWGLAVVLLMLLIAGVLFNTRLAGPVEPTSAILCSLQFVLALVYVAAIFAYGFESKLEVRESGFPARQFALPVRTMFLVGWP